MAAHRMNEFSCQYAGLRCAGPVYCPRTHDAAHVCRVDEDGDHVALQLVRAVEGPCPVLRCGDANSDLHMRNVPYEGVLISAFIFINSR